MYADLISIYSLSTIGYSLSSIAYQLAVSKFLMFFFLYFQLMVSKKKPVKLTWTNDSPMAECYLPEFKVIFKNGDGMLIDGLSFLLLQFTMWPQYINVLSCLVFNAERVILSRVQRET